MRMGRSYSLLPEVRIAPLSGEDMRHASVNLTLSVLRVGLVITLCGGASAAPPEPAPLRATQAWRLDHDSNVYNAMWSADARTIVGCIDGDDPAVWDAATGALTLRIKAPTPRTRRDPCLRTPISADGRVIGVEDPTGMRIVDVQSGTQVAVLPGRYNRFVLDHDPLSGAFAVVTSDELQSSPTVEVWIPPADAPALSLPFEHGITSLRFSEKGTQLTALTEQHFNKARDRLKRPIIRSITWSLPSGKVRARGSGRKAPDWTHRDPSPALERVIEKAEESGNARGWLQAPKGDQVLVAQRFRYVIYNRKTLDEPVELQGLKNLHNSVIALSPISEQVAVGGHDGWVRVYRVGQPVRRLRAHPSHVEALAISPNDAWLASGQQGWAVWDLVTGEKVHGGDGSVRSMAFSGDSSVLAVADGDVELWNTSDWSLRSTFKGIPGRALAIVVPTPKGFLLGQADASGIAPLPAPLAELSPPAWMLRPLAPAYVDVYAFSRTPTGQIVGTHIVDHSVSTDVRIWEVDKADAFLKWDRPEAPDAVAVGPHGWIGSLSWDWDSKLSQVSLWHPATGKTATIEGHVVPNNSSQRQLHFGNNGKGLVALDVGGGVTYWTIDAELGR